MLRSCPFITFHNLSQLGVLLCKQPTNNARLSTPTHSAVPWTARTSAEREIRVNQARIFRHWWIQCWPRNKNMTQNVSLAARSDCGLQAFTARSTFLSARFFGGESVRVYLQQPCFALSSDCVVCNIPSMRLNQGRRTRHKAQLDDIAPIRPSSEPCWQQRWRLGTRNWTSWRRNCDATDAANNRNRRSYYVITLVLFIVFIIRYRLGQVAEPPDYRRKQDMR